MGFEIPDSLRSLKCPINSPRPDSRFLTYKGRIRKTNLFSWLTSHTLQKKLIANLVCGKYITI